MGRGLLRRGGPDVHKDALVLLKRLQSITVVPIGLALEGVGFHYNIPFLAGMYSDVYRLVYDGEEVAVKRLHGFPTNRHRDEAGTASISDYCCSICSNSL
jgi:hypothetical protein